MAHPLQTTVQDFVEGLKQLEAGVITGEVVSRYMDSMRLSEAALAPYAYFRDEYYTRNLIFRDDYFEVMAICWKSGQKTPIHSHNGQMGWMTIARGEIDVHNFRYAGCNHPENQNVVGLDCLAGATRIELNKLGSVSCGVGGPVYQVDKLQSIHQIDNSDSAKAGCVTLHIYSLPFDSCVAYDLEKQKCFRKTLSYFSQYGNVELESERSADGKLNIIV